MNAILKSAMAVLFGLGLAFMQAKADDPIKIGSVLSVHGAGCISRRSRTEDPSALRREDQ